MLCVLYSSVFSLKLNAKMQLLFANVLRYVLRFVEVCWVQFRFDPSPCSLLTTQWFRGSGCSADSQSIRAWTIRNFGSTFCGSHTPVSPLLFSALSSKFTNPKEFHFIQFTCASCINKTSVLSENVYSSDVYMSSCMLHGCVLLTQHPPFHIRR